MKRCWSSDIDKRPKVHKVKTILDQWRHNPPYDILQEFRKSDELPKELPPDPVYGDTAIINNTDQFVSKFINNKDSNLFTGTLLVEGMAEGEY